MFLALSCFKPDGEPPFSQGLSMDSGGVGVPDGSNGDKLQRETSAPSEYPHEVGNNA